jgi:hypothetical protein
LCKHREAEYLGMYLEGKLTWKNHVERTVKKTKKKLNVLKKLAGSKWGSSRSVLNVTYKAIYKPALQ